MILQPQCIADQTGKKKGAQTCFPDPGQGPAAKPWEKRPKQCRCNSAAAASGKDSDTQQRQYGQGRKEALYRFDNKVGPFTRYTEMFEDLRHKIWIDWRHPGGGPGVCSREWRTEAVPFGDRAGNISVFVDV